MAAAAEEIQEFIAHANGADHMIRHPLTGMTYSSGMGWIAENAGAYWLIDAILINSKHKRLQEVCEGFEVWTLTKNETGSGAKLVCTDGGMDSDEAKTVYTQRIPYTDFPLQEITMYVDGGILLLPGER